MTMQASHTGRLLRYDPARGRTDVLADGLWFANGVALAPDESYVVVVETMRARLLRVWLRGPQARLQLGRVRLGEECTSRTWWWRRRCARACCACGCAAPRRAAGPGACAWVASCKDGLTLTRPSASADALRPAARSSRLRGHEVQTMQEVNMVSTPLARPLALGAGPRSAW